MLITELVRWWYTAGLRQNVQMVALRLDGTIDFFSLSLLVKTLFAPFRQDSAGKVRGALNVQMRALIDNLMSRIIGAVIRMLLLLIGGVAIILQLLLSLMYLIVWVILPALPLFGFLGGITGVVI